MSEITLAKLAELIVVTNALLTILLMTLLLYVVYKLPFNKKKREEHIEFYKNYDSKKKKGEQ